MMRRSKSFSKFGRCSRILVVLALQPLLLSESPVSARVEDETSRELTFTRAVHSKRLLSEAKASLGELNFLAQPTVFDKSVNGYLVFNSSLEVVGRYRHIRIPGSIIDISSGGGGRIGTIGGECEFPFLGMSACSKLITFEYRKSILESSEIEIPGFRFDFHDLKFVEASGSYFGLAYTIKDCAENPTLCRSSHKWFADCEVSEISATNGREIRRWAASKHLSGQEVSWQRWRFGLGGPDLPQSFSPTGLYSDPFHCNSLDFIASSSRNGAGQIMLSMRHTDSLYGINWPSGEIAWKLGGKPSPARLSNCTGHTRKESLLLGGQHDARYVTALKGLTPRETFDISVFDNGNNTKRGARGLLLQVVPSSNCYKIKTLFRDPTNAKSLCTGSFRVLDRGYALAGWGCSTSGLTLFDRNGNPIVSSSIDSNKSSWALVSPLPALRTQVSYRVLPIRRRIIEMLASNPGS